MESLSHNLKKEKGGKVGESLRKLVRVGAVLGLVAGAPADSEAKDTKQDVIKAQIDKLPSPEHSLEQKRRAYLDKMDTVRVLFNSLPVAARKQFVHVDTLKEANTRFELWFDKYQTRLMGLSPDGSIDESVKNVDLWYNALVAARKSEEKISNEWQAAQESQEHTTQKFVQDKDDKHALDAIVSNLANANSDLIIDEPSLDHPHAPAPYPKAPESPVRVPLKVKPALVTATIPVDVAVPQYKKSGMKPVESGQVKAGKDRVQVTSVENEKEARRLYLAGLSRSSSKGFDEFVTAAEYEQSIADFTAALRLKPDYVEALRDRAFAYDGIGQHDRAMEDINEALRLNPNNVDTLEHRGIMYFVKGEYARAEADYRKALELHPTNVAVQRGLKRVLKKQGKE